MDFVFFGVEFCSKLVYGKRMLITPAQIRAARALLEWSGRDLAARLKVSPATISMIESGHNTGSVDTLTAMMAEFTRAGIEFLPNDGVARKQASVLEYKGAEGFRAFMDDVYETARDIGGDICLHNAQPTYWDKWLGKDWGKMHIPRMLEIKNKYTLRITCPYREDMQVSRTYAEYRWIPNSLFNDRGIYCYGSKLAFLNFEQNFVQILVINQPEFADGFRGMFNIMWENVAEPIPEGGGSA